MQELTLPNARQENLIAVQSPGYGVSLGTKIRFLACPFSPVEPVELRQVPSRQASSFATRLSRRNADYLDI
jgi:hypothetical protein